MWLCHRPWGRKERGRRHQIRVNVGVVAADKIRVVLKVRHNRRGGLQRCRRRNGGLMRL